MSQVARSDRWWRPAALRARLLRWLPVCLGPVLAAAGFALGFVALFTGAAGDVSGYQRVVVPGDGLVALAADTSYTVYYESRSTVDGTRYDTGTVHGLACGLRGPGGTPVALRARRHDDSGYTLGGYSGESVYDFRSGTAGRYSLTCSYAEQADRPIVLALTDGAGTPAAVAILAGMFAVIGTGIAVGVVQHVRRLRPPERRPARRSLAGRLVVPGLVVLWAALLVGMFALTR